MREDQLQRLTDLRDELIDTALQDADPQQWTGAGKAPADMTQEERGDAYWCRKMATATVALLSRVHGMVAAHTVATSGNLKPVDDLDKEIGAAEREAARLLERIQAGSNARH